MMPRLKPDIIPVSMIGWLKSRVKTPIENGKEIPSKRNIPVKIESNVESKPIATDSCNKLKNTENLEKPIAWRAPNSLIREVKAAKRVFRPPINAPIEMRKADIHVIHLIGA